MPDIRPARAGEDAAVARLLYLAAHGMYDLYAGGRPRALRLIEASLASRRTGASRDTVTVAEVDGEPAGVLAAFPSSEATARDTRFVLLALRRLAPWRWGPILKVEMQAARLFPPPPKDSLYVDTLATDERFRRRGVARALLAAAERQARALGLTRIALDTTESNAPARALYESEGFQAVRHVPGVGVIPPEVIYVRELR
jgi:ribosomal protein S18 acetylase RimI-like enzyme